MDELSDFVRRADPSGLANALPACARNGSRETVDAALIAAAGFGLHEVVDVILRSVVGIGDQVLGHALRTAARAGPPMTARVLLEAGADPDSASPTNADTPLGIAARWGHDEIIKLLLRHGADRELADASGWVPARTAAACGRDAAARLLFGDVVTPFDSLADEFYSQDRDSPEGDLCLAAAQGSLDEIRRLIVDVGMSPDCYDPLNNNTPFILGSAYARIDSAELLLEMGADPELSVGSGQRAVLAAADSWPSAMWSRADMVTFLAAHGACVNVRDRKGFTPLMTAAASGEQGRADVVRSLLEHGANPHLPDGRGRSPILMAQHSKGSEADEVVRELMRAGCEPENVSEVVRAARANDFERVCEMVAQRASPDERDPLTGRTPLQMAIRSKDDRAVRMLLESGTDVRLADYTGGTALHEAASYAAIDVIQDLLDAGADCEAMDDRGRTPLMFACEHGRLDVVGMLVDAGADCSLRSDEGRNAVTVAANAGRAEVADFLEARTQVMRQESMPRGRPPPDPGGGLT